MPCRRDIEKLNCGQRLPGDEVFTADPTRSYSQSWPTCNICVKILLHLVMWNSPTIWTILQFVTLIFRYRKPHLTQSLWHFAEEIQVSPEKDRVSPFLKGTVAWDFYDFWLEWITLGLNRNFFWFFSFKEIPSILDSQFKYWCISYQTFSEFIVSPRRIENWVRGSPSFLFSGLAILQETLQWVSILLGDS